MDTTDFIYGFWWGITFVGVAGMTGFIYMSFAKLFKSITGG